MLTPIPLPPNPPPRSRGFGPRLSAEFGPDVLLRPLGPPRPPPHLPRLCLPLGHPAPVPAEKEVSGPQGAAERRSGRAADTCEARHLRATGGGPARAHPLGAQAPPRREPPYLRATGARGASSSQ